MNDIETKFQGRVFREVVDGLEKYLSHLPNAETHNVITLRAILMQQRIGMNVMRKIHGEDYFPERMPRINFKSEQDFKPYYPLLRVVEESAEKYGYIFEVN